MKERSMESPSYAIPERGEGTELESRNSKLVFDLDTLEKYITPQLSNSCDKAVLMQKIENGMSISFVLNSSLSLYVSDKMHTEIRRMDGSDYHDEIAYGRYFPFKEVIMENDMRCAKEQTKILQIVLSKKISDFLKQYKNKTQV